jgi:hypothetical protein
MLTSHFKLSISSWLCMHDVTETCVQIIGVTILILKSFSKCNGFFFLCSFLVDSFLLSLLNC